MTRQIHSDEAGPKWSQEVTLAVGPWFGGLWPGRDTATA